MKIDITELLSAVIALVSMLITSVLIPYIKSKLNYSRAESLQKWVKVAVLAAEQLYADSGLGERKKEYVLDFLNSKGFVLNAEEIEALIESEVYKLKA